MAIRKKIKPYERVIIFSKSNFKCNICKLSFSVPFAYNGKNTLYENGKWLEIDHIKPISKGGEDVLKNKQALCNICNCKKYNNG